MYRSLLFCILFAVSISSCRPTKESLVDICTGEKMAGYDKACKWQINKTKRQDYSAEDMQRFKDNLLLVFSEWRGQKLPTNILLAVFGGQEMATSKGIAVGDPLSRAEQLYGKPWARFVEIGLNPATGEPIGLHGLFYDNLVFLSDESNKMVLAIMIGKIGMIDRYSSP